MVNKTKPTSSICQLKISLKWLKPPIWRRVLVPADISLAKLHQVTQTVMGWEDHHLHQFRVGEKTYGGPALTEDDFYDPPVEDENKARLGEIATEEGDKFLYEYDFGDNWEHEVLVEKIITPDPELRYPICLTGKRACPPEDCGGPPGYEDMLEVLADPANPEYQEILEWLGDALFDPEAFDLEEINS